jgi:hypothetical protein|tara:strand:- start:328 stop:1047 length:720 start_codon:yes stop_codon:yes gene_type:complete
MVKDLIYIINELTERGLVKESGFLYSIFRKVAYETTERAEQLFNLANPNRNSSENERHIAARNLHRILEDIDRPEFGYKELANIIINQGAQEAFDSRDFLGGVLTSDEINILKQLIEPSEESDRWEGQEEREAWGPSHGEPGYRRRRASEAYERQRAEDEQRIRSVLSSLVGTIQFVNIERTRGVSKAAVSSFIGDLVTFIVPVNKEKLGFKTFSVRDLISSDFIRLNSSLFRERSGRF